MPAARGYSTLDLPQLCPSDPNCTLRAFALISCSSQLPCTLGTCQVQTALFVRALRGPFLRQWGNPSALVRALNVVIAGHAESGIWSAEPKAEAEEEADAESTAATAAPILDDQPPPGYQTAMSYNTRTMLVACCGRPASLLTFKGSLFFKCYLLGATQSTELKRHLAACSNYATECIIRLLHCSCMLVALCRTEYKSKGKKKKKKSDQTDHYALLGLQQERWTATEAQIKLGQPPALLTSTAS